MNTLALYLGSAVLTALSWDFRSFMAFRFLTGTAIGEEYSAINELIPARVRGRFNLAINGSYWLDAATGLLFVTGRLDAVMQTLCWSLVFFMASPAASASCLTVSELFPIEIRALAIAVFYAFGTALGGMAAPALFGLLVETGQPIEVFYGYLVGTGFMLVAASVELWIGVAAARRSLEEVARPLTATSAAGLA